MDRGPTIFLGVFLTFAAAWLGLVAIPYLEFHPLQPAEDEASQAVYPRPTSGLAVLGRKVYQANGCIYCHSQQVRGDGFGADLDRGWGSRRTVARDYLYDDPILLGTMRTGPDLTNIGSRQPSETWHHLHLYNPRITSPGSTMPTFGFLYKKQKFIGQPSVDALNLPDEWAVEEGYEVVPTREAKALVAYLLSLDRTFPLEEAEAK